MKNAILERWRSTLAANASRVAIFEANGIAARTFADLESEAALVAGHLQDHRGGVVSIWAQNHPCWPALVLGIWKAECCALLVDRATPESALSAAEVACGAGARVSITEDRRLVTGLGSDGDRGLQNADLIKLTSGTSGTPRPILFNADQLVADCDNVCETMGIRPEDLNYGVTAFSHSYGFSNLVTPLLCRGVPLVAAVDALPRAVISGLQATSATVLPSVPAVFQAMSKLDGDCPDLRLCISAGAPLAANVARGFRERFGRKIHSFYGASECGGICYDATDDDVAEDGFVGLPLNGVDVKIVDSSGPETRIRVCGAAVCLTDSEGGAVRDGVFEPPDLLARCETGWRIVGRVTDVINVAGRKVSPADIESVLRTHPEVADVVVFGTVDAGRGEAIAAWVVPNSSVSTAELGTFCAERLAAWQVPREFRCVDTLPTNVRGKISRAEIARLHAQS